MFFFFFFFPFWARKPIKLEFSTHKTCHNFNQYSNKNGNFTEISSLLLKLVTISINIFNKI